MENIKDHAPDGDTAAAGPAEAEVAPAEAGGNFDGLRDRTIADFADIQHWGSRRAAFAEYQRTLDEFRQTGALEDKEWGDFAHLTNPPGLRCHVFNAHGEASQEIERWQDEQEARAQEARRAEQLRAVRQELLASIAARPESLSAGRPEACAASNAAPAPMPQLSVQPAQESAPPLPAPGLLRGIVFDPALPSRMNAYDPRVPQLDLAAVPERMPASDAETERLLNTIIGECHFLMQQVAFPSMCQAGVLEDRRLWANTAMDFARTGAKVAKEVARLRHGSSLKETRHTTTVIQNRVVAEVGGGGCASS